MGQRRYNNNDIYPAVVWNQSEPQDNQGASTHYQIQMSYLARFGSGHAAFLFRTIPTRAYPAAGHIFKVPFLVQCHASKLQSFRTISNSSFQLISTSKHFSSIPNAKTETSNGRREESKLLSKEELQEFNDLFPVMVENIKASPDFLDLPHLKDWYTNVLEYNVPFGMKIRGSTLIAAYRHLAKEFLTPQNVKLSHVLGWCVEILGSYYLVVDDIMDESHVRRGRPCWYKQDGVRLTAINDAIFLQACVYVLLKKYFREKEYYIELMEEFQQTNFLTINGEGLELLMGKEKGPAKFTADVCNSIAKYKTSFYTFVLPMNLAMTMAGIRDNRKRDRVRDLMLQMGHFLQVKNDYFDTFGNPKDTGKIGSDIADNTCSWLIVSALEKANDDQCKILLDNYGRKNPENINAVKHVYMELQLPDLYQSFKEDKFRSINKQIDELSPELPVSLLRDMAYELYSHSC